ncbi:MAG: hypothetical protein ACTXOO_02225 [Sodalis sp. (in: enterobacteria)]
MTKRNSLKDYSHIPDRYRPGYRPRSRHCFTTEDAANGRSDDGHTQILEPADTSI